MFKSRAEKYFSFFLFPTEFLSPHTGLVFAVFFDSFLNSKKYSHQRKCFFERALGVGRKRSDKKMEFENVFCFHLNHIFYMNYSLLSVAALYGSSKHTDHRVMQNKEYDISLSCYCVNGERIQKLQFLPVLSTNVARSSQLEH